MTMVTNTTSVAPKLRASSLRREEWNNISLQTRHRIMNFELKTLDLAQLAREKCDALLVLVDDHFKPGSGALSELVAQALKSGDFSAKTGRLLQTYRHPGLAATRLVLVGAGDGSVKQVRNAAAAAVNAIKASRCKQVVLHLGALAAVNEAVVSGAMLAVADATYVYTTTKPKAEARSLQTVTLGVADAAACQAGHRNPMYSALI
eukprot:Opistho-1_new@50004